MVVSALWLHPWHRPRSTILPTMIGYCPNTDGAHSFWYEEINVDVMHMQPHYYGVRQVEPYHRLFEVAWHSCRAIELLALCLSKNSYEYVFAIFYSCALSNQTWMGEGTQQTCTVCNVDVLRSLDAIRSLLLLCFHSVSKKWVLIHLHHVAQNNPF